MAELAIPHFTTRTIFSVANLGSEAKFYANVKTLAVSSDTFCSSMHLLICLTMFW